MEKAIPKVDASGLWLNDVIDIGFSSVTPLYEDGNTEPYAYLVTVPVNGKFYRPRFDLAAWKKYQDDLETAWFDYDVALSNWFKLPEAERGPKPELLNPDVPEKLWTEGLTQAEIDELLKQGEQPPSEIEELRLLVADLYEYIATGGN